MKLLLILTFLCFCHLNLNKKYYLIETQKELQPTTQSARRKSDRGIGDQLFSGEHLNSGEQIVSKNGVYKLIMQTDGNLVLYKGNNDSKNALWSTQTHGPPGLFQFRFSKDGIFGIKDLNGSKHTWISDSWMGDANKLIIQNDGKLVLYTRTNEVIWSSTSLKGRKLPNGFEIACDGNLGPTEVCGRPFLVQGISRITCSQTCTNKNINEAQLWKIGETPSILPNNKLNKEIGRHWLKQAEAEHASVASFARHTLQLMSIGAPFRLLIASMEAGLDEINHAKMCYGLASAFIGLDFGPGSFDVHGSLERIDLRDIIRSIIIEGCFGETLSAIEAQLAAHIAEDPAVKATLLQIASDETKHGQFAWDTIKWVIEKFPDMRKFADNIFDVELEERKKPARNDTSLLATALCEASEKYTSFHRYGLLFLEDQEKVRETGIRDIIEPVYHDGFKNVNMISKLIKSLDVTTVWKHIF